MVYDMLIELLFLRVCKAVMSCLYFCNAIYPIGRSVSIKMGGFNVGRSLLYTLIERYGEISHRVQIGKGRERKKKKKIKTKHHASVHWTTR